jgi:hypothetical protein
MQKTVVKRKLIEILDQCEKIAKKHISKGRQIAASYGCNEDDAQSFLVEQDSKRHGKIFLSIKSIEKYAHGNRVDTFLWNKKSNNNGSWINTVFAAINRRLNVTKKSNIGSLDRLFKDYNPKTFADYEKTYFKLHKDKYKKAILKYVESCETFSMDLFKATLPVKSSKNVKKEATKYLYQLILPDSYHGFLIQKAIFHYIKDEFGLAYRESMDEEDSKSIDGFLDNVKVSVKSKNYPFSNQAGLHKKDVRIIYYEKFENGVEFDLREIRKLL